MMSEMFNLKFESIYIILFMIISTLINMMWNNNPMKFCWSLMMIMSSVSIILFMLMKSSIIPIISSMIMLGGILIMYMIMASMTPNTPIKSTKWNLIKIMMMTVMTMLIIQNWNKMKWNMDLTPQMKSLMVSNNSFITVTCMMLTYFLMSSKFLESESLSMRSYY